MRGHTRLSHSIRLRLMVLFMALLIVFTVRIIATVFKLDLPKIKYPQEN